MMKVLFFCRSRTEICENKLTNLDSRTFFSGLFWATWPFNKRRGAAEFLLLLPTNKVKTRSGSRRVPPASPPAARHTAPHAHTRHHYQDNHPPIGSQRWRDQRELQRRADGKSLHPTERGRAGEREGLEKTRWRRKKNCRWSQRRRK